MNNKFSLISWMSIFVIFIFIAFALIIYKDKEVIFLPQVDKKLNTYFDNHYSDIKNEVTIKETIFNDEKNQFEKEIVLNKAKVSFYIYYKNKVITDNYKEAN